MAIVRLSALPLVHALGWTLLDFCWQGAIVGIILASALGLLPLRASRLRYAVACAAMALMIVLPAITFGVLATNPQRFVIAAAAEDFGHVLNKSDDQSAEPWILQFEKVLNQLLPAVIGFWFTGVLILLGRLNFGLVATRRMKYLAVESVPTEIEHVLHTLSGRLRISRVVKLLNSARVQTPMVIGWLKPAILLPVGCMAGMSLRQIEAILAHELAHIRRHDYLINLFQSLIETLLFYHPAVWWVSSQIRREREHCCDDLAVAVCGDPLAYAQALSSLEERRSPVPAGAFSATGGVLKMRIARLLGLKQSPAFPRTPAAILLALVVATVGLALWGSARAQSASLLQGTTSSQASSAKSVSPSQSAPSTKNVPVQVRSLAIQSNDLPESDRAEIVQAYTGGTYPLEELIERIRFNLSDRGYAKARAEILQPTAAPAGQPPQAVDVSAHVSAGAKYTSSAASIATGWSDPVPGWDLHPLWSSAFHGAQLFPDRR